MSAIPTVETPRLCLREWREADAGPLARILGEPEVARYLFRGEPLDETAAREAFDRRVASWRADGFGFWAVELKDTGELIGWAGLQRAHAEKGLEGSVEIGWALGREWWGRGYATEAAEASLTYGFRELRLDRIYAFYVPENARSESVMVRLGMEPAGETTDLLDGSVSKIRVITSERRQRLLQDRGRPDPRRDVVGLARAIGYYGTGVAALASAVLAEQMREALLGALVRSWPGRRLPGEPLAYDAVGQDPGTLGMRMSEERVAGSVPLLVFTELAHPGEIQARLMRLHAEAAREGVWLHADLASPGGTRFEGLSRADSIAFDVRTSSERRRVFATKHRRILDGPFLADLGVYDESVAEAPFG